MSREGVPIIEDNLERKVADDETTQFLVNTTKRINVDGLFVNSLTAMVTYLRPLFFRASC